MNIAPIDLFFMAIVLIFTVRCALRGFIKEFMSMAAIVLGLIAAIALLKPATAQVSKWLGPNMFPELVAFAALFLAVFILIKIFGRALNDISEKVNAEAFDRILGFAFGMLEGLVLVCLILFVLNLQTFFDAHSFLHGSIFAKYLLPLVSSVQTNTLGRSI